MPSPTATRSRKKLEAPGLSVVIFALFSAYVVVCGLTSFWLGPEGLLMCTLLLLLEVAVVAESVDHRHPTIPWLALMWLSTIWVASAVGVRNFHACYSPYLTANSGRHYTGVDPSSKASAFMDAGMVEFNKGALLDDTLSVGLQIAGGTYCAAPVLSRGGGGGGGAGDAGAAPVVQFWAVGLDCCGSRGGFLCDDAGEAGANGGIVWGEVKEEAASAIFPPSELRSGYLRAVQAACALHDLRAADRPLLLRWMSHPRRALQGWFTRSLLVLILSSIAFGTVIAILCFFVDYYFDADMRAAMEELAIGRPPGDIYGSTGQTSKAASPGSRFGGP